MSLARQLVDMLRFQHYAVPDGKFRYCLLADDYENPKYTLAATIASDKGRVLLRVHFVQEDGSLACPLSYDCAYYIDSPQDLQQVRDHEIPAAIAAVLSWADTSLLFSCYS
jgi:hypothetical protein